MSWRDWFKTADDPAQPTAMALKPHPLTQNPTDDERIERIRMRLARCKQAHEESRDAAYKDRMAEAITRHRSALRAVGITEE